MYLCVSYIQKLVLTLVNSAISLLYDQVSVTQMPVGQV